MNTKRFLALLLSAVFVAAACGNTATPSSPASQPAPSATAAGSTEPSASAPAESAAPSPLAPDPAEAVIPNVEQGAEVTLWTFWLSPTFDDYIKATIARFEATYPGVTVKWEDHQATFQDDLKNSFAAGNAPDVINLSVGEGWVSDYATRDLLLDLDANVPQAVKDIYFEGLWKSQNVAGKNYQFPWYQGVSVELINKRIYEEGA
ncbi:MAG: ABC transporter substrate-binding protein, partial [Candidatus Limnocylindrales bacterium]